uniref:Uncharacterized protein n=1 Tax=Stegastes partitus TaxID=144197 RepID=A0A3B5BM95_9TELE
GAKLHNCLLVNLLLLILPSFLLPPLLPSSWGRKPAPIPAALHRAEVLEEAQEIRLLYKLYTGWKKSPHQSWNMCFSVRTSFTFWQVEERGGVVSGCYWRKSTRPSFFFFFCP